YSGITSAQLLIAGGVAAGGATGVIGISPVPSSTPSGTPICPSTLSGLYASSSLSGTESLTSSSGVSVTTVMVVALFGGLGSVPFGGFGGSTVLGFGGSTTSVRICSPFVNCNGF